MTTTRTTLILIFVSMFGMSACRDKLPCPDCDEDVAAEDDDDDTPGPDLPCGGADLMTDNLNCGTCGHECQIWYDDTMYEAGSCNTGVCGPGGWSGCEAADAFDPEENCTEICVALGEACVPNGCAGLTGMMYDVLFGQGCDPHYAPVVALTGGCDEPIPWMTPTDNTIEVMCCCDFQQPG